MTLLGATAPLRAEGWRAACDAQPLIFELPSDEAEAAWERAQAWLTTIPRVPLAVATDAILQVPFSRNLWGGTDPGYTVARQAVHEGVRFTIQVVFPRGVFKPSRDGLQTTGRVLARFVQTGAPACLTREAEECFAPISASERTTGDFSEALQAPLGPAAGLSPSTIVRLKAGWEEEYQAWQEPYFIQYLH